MTGFTSQTLKSINFRYTLSAQKPNALIKIIGEGKYKAFNIPIIEPHPEIVIPLLNLLIQQNSQNICQFKILQLYLTNEEFEYTYLVVEQFTSKRREVTLL